MDWAVNTPVWRSGGSLPRFGLARVRGRSMQPALRDGDLLLIRRAPQRARLGQLVVVRLPDRPIAVKRLISFQDGGWWVERDNPAEGVDSWLVGAIEPAAQLAVVIARLWPRPGRLTLDIDKDSQ